LVEKSVASHNVDWVEIKFHNDEYEECPYHRKLQNAIFTETDHNKILANQIA